MMSDSRLKEITIEQYMSYVERKRQQQPDAEINAQEIMNEMVQESDRFNEDCDELAKKVAALSSGYQFKKTEATEKQRGVFSGMFSRFKKKEGNSVGAPRGGVVKQR